MRFILILIALSLLLTSCSRRSRVVGTWHDSSGAVAVVFNPDGSYTSGDNDTRYTGIWRINGQMLVMTLTNVTGPHPYGKVGDTVRFRIIRVDSHVLSTKIDGQTNSLNR